MCKEEIDISKTFVFLRDTIRSYLDQEIQGKKFKGTIIIEFNCIDGNIGSFSTTVTKNYNKNDSNEIKY